jgi:hypothetical protein
LGITANQSGINTEVPVAFLNPNGMARRTFALDGDKWKGRYREDEITGEGTKRVRRRVLQSGVNGDPKPTHLAYAGSSP